MDEARVRTVLLVRAAEEGEPGCFSEETRWRAQEAAGDRADPEAWLARRAAHLAERLPPAHRRVAAIGIPGRGVVLALCAAAFLAGGVADALGPGGTIQALWNPVCALILWNAGVTLALLVRGRLARTAQAGRREVPRLVRGGVAVTGRRLGAPLRALRWLVLLPLRLGRGSRDAADEGAPPAGGAFAARYVRHLFAACAPVFGARALALFSLAAIAFALGAFAGILVRGVFFEYGVAWKTTLLTSPAARLALVWAFFFPAAPLLGDAFPNQETLRAMAEAPVPAGPWLAMFGAALAFWVIVPRALLALHALRTARRASDAIALDLSDPYYAEALRRLPPPVSLLPAVLRHFALDANAASALASLQLALVQADLRATAVRSWDPRRLLDRKQAWLREWRALVERGFAELEGPDRPRFLAEDSPELAAAFAAARGGANPFAAELVLLELAAFEAYWPLSGETRTSALERLGGPALADGVREASLALAAERLGLPAGLGNSLRADVKATLSTLSGVSRARRLAIGAGAAVGALALGIAAPFLGGLVGGAIGLAALKAGLAALGAGALAAGGLGLKGGALLLVGGGAVLGAGAGATTPLFAGEAKPETVLLACAKLDVFLRRVVLERHHDRTARDAIHAELREETARLAAELPSLQVELGEKALGERRRSMRYMERTLSRLDARRDASEPVADG